MKVCTKRVSVEILGLSAVRCVRKEFPEFLRDSGLYVVTKKLELLGAQVVIKKLKQIHI